MKKILVLPAFLVIATLAPFTSCTKEKETPDTPQVVPTELTVNSDFQFTGTLDGAIISHVDYKNGFNIHTFNEYESASEPDTSRAIYESGIGNSNSQGFTLVKGARAYQKGDENNLDNLMVFFAKGSYTLFNEKININTEKGIELNYRDASGNEWASYGGSQTGSVVTIEDVKKIDNANYHGVIIKAKIKCNLYPVGGSGTSKKADLTAILRYSS